MLELSINKKQFRSFIVAYQGLNISNPKVGKQGVIDFLYRVGTVQYDVLNVVGRNADLVLQSRVKNYKSKILKDLMYNERKLVDGWDKVMSIYPAKDWIKLSRVREKQKLSVIGSLKYRKSEKALELVDEVVSIVEENGPLMAKDINLGSVSRTSWGFGKLSSATLDYLFHVGILGIHGKNQNQKKYDLINKLLPHEYLCPENNFKSDNDFYKWYFKRRINSIGIYWDKSGDGWLGHYLSDKKLRERTIYELYQNRELVKVKVDSITEDFYIDKKNLDLLQTSHNFVKKKVSFLAPLDNLLWDRKMIQKIFGFHYTWEVYTPKSKRKYGYYVLPVLYGDKFVARFEVKKHYPGQPIEIINWWWEDNVKKSKTMLNEIIKALNRFSYYLDAENLPYNEVEEILIKH